MHAGKAKQGHNKYKDKIFWNSSQDPKKDYLFSWSYRWENEKQRKTSITFETTFGPELCLQLLKPVIADLICGGYITSHYINLVDAFIQGNF